MIRAAGMPTVLLAGGGTGGHLFPGLAVAEEVQLRAPGARVLLAATEREQTALHGRGLRMDTVRVASPRRPAGLRSAPAFGARLVGAVARALRAIRRERADVVVGLGGYGSVAPVIAARLARVPVVLLEQNAVPGRATRALARFADVVATSFPESLPPTGGARVVTTGNPVRRQILDAAPAHERYGLSPRKPVIGVLGGSLGARMVNLRFAEALPAIVAKLGGPRERRLQILHATGSIEAATALAELYATHGVRALVRPFFEDMGAFYGTCDALVSRAGGTAVAEIAAAGLPSLLVPYPHHRDDHQAKNASALVAAGAAVLVPETDLTAARIADELRSMLGDRESRLEKSAGARSVARPRAAGCVADIVLECARNTVSPPPPSLSGRKLEATTA